MRSRPPWRPKKRPWTRRPRRCAPWKTRYKHPCACWTPWRQSLASSREALTGARAALIDSVQGPAQLFESRKADLQALVRSLPGASLEGRVAALPEIAALTQEVVQLAKQGELFGDDVAAFRQLQQQLLAQLDQAETFARTPRPPWRRSKPS